MCIFLFRPIALPADSCLGGISSWQDKKEQGPACPVAGGVSGNVASPISPMTTGDHWRPLAVQEAFILALNFFRNLLQLPTSLLPPPASCLLPAPPLRRLDGIPSLLQTRLGNPGVRKVVDSIVFDALTSFLSAHAAALEAVVAKAMQAFKAAEAAKKARELVRRKSVLRTAMLPGKLADCSSQNPAECGEGGGE